MNMKHNSEQLKKEIWKSMDLLRNLGVNSDSYHVVLFLLILKREGNLPGFNIKSSLDLNQQLKAIVHSTEIPELMECYDRTYESLLKQFGPSSLSVLLSTIRSVEIENNDAFPETFDWALFRILESIGRTAGTSLLPENLSSFMTELCEVSENSLVYNPFAGLASFGVYLKDNVNYVGQELNSLVWSLGTLRRIAYKKSNGYFLHEDSISEWVHQTEFDLIISAPPFGKVNLFKKRPDIGIKSCDQYVVEKGLESLKDDGKLVVLVAESFLFGSGAYIPVRKRLIEEDLVRTIISLPPGIFYPFSGIKSSILVLDRNKKEKGAITLIDGTQFSTKDQKRVDLNYEKLKKAIRTGKEADGLIRIYNEKVVKQDYNLEVSRYFWKEEVNERTDTSENIQLIEILTEIKGVRTSEDSTNKNVSIKHLAKDNLDYKLNLKEVEPVDGRVKNGRVISTSCLLVAKIGNDLKPTFFEFLGEAIEVSNNVMAFQISEDKVDLDYFINELYSEFVLRQLKIYRRGVAQKSIKKSDFLKIQIPLPSPQEQKKIMKGVKEAFIQSRVSEVELQKELLGYKDEAFREFASIRHTFRQYLNSLKSNVSGTSKFISKNEGKEITLNSVYSKNLDRTLGEHLKSLEGTIDSMSHLLTTFEEKEIKQRDQEDKFNLIQLLEEGQNRFKNPEKFIFEKLYIDKESLTDFSGYYTPPIIKINKEDFFTLFSNIVSNAVEHGFRNSKGNKMRAVITNDFDSNMHVIEISNNGSPFPEGFEFQNLITRGDKTSDSEGTGMGGADIKSIMTHYGGIIELENNPESPFPVTYILKFPFHYDVIL